MHHHGRIRRFISVLILGTAGFAVALLMTATSASAATTPAFTLKSSISGGITTVQTGQTLTFVFTETNQSTHAASRDIVITKVTKASVTALTCVDPSGFAFNPDGYFCEPGLLQPGQQVSSVLTTTVTGASGAVASARACLFNEKTGVYTQCRTRSVKIA